MKKKKGIRKKLEESQRGVLKRNSLGSWGREPTGIEKSLIDLITRVSVKKERKRESEKK